MARTGIFTTAQKAAQNYTQAQNQELADLQDFTDLVDDTINGVIRTEGISLNKTSMAIGVQQTETLIATISPNNTTNTNLTWTSSDETVATVSNGTITGIKVGTTIITATAQDKSGRSASCTVKVSSTLSELAEPGDYVKYDGGNGYTGLWQVLYNDPNYGLQIISAGSVKDFTLGASTETEAKASYNGAVDTLNAECAKYVNTSFATSGRCVGSNPLSPADEVAADNTVQFSKSYWLASRYIHTSSSYEGFDMQFVNYGTSSGGHLWGVDSSGNSYPTSKPNGLRPVITLVTDIQISSGNGSSEGAFQLVEK